MTNIDNIAEHTEKKPKSVSLVLGAQAFAFVASFVSSSLFFFDCLRLFTIKRLRQAKGKARHLTMIFTVF